MGILSKPKRTMDYSVWDPHTLTLNKDIENQILTRIKKLAPNIKEVFILGSITGFKYDGSSDIDVNVRIPLEDITEERLSKRKKMNGEFAANTKHPINYFLQPYEKDATWEDTPFGVYDVIKREWVSKPPERKTIRDPNEEFYFELISANVKLEEFRRKVKRWEKFKNIKNPSSVQKILLTKYFNEARKYAKHLDEERKLVYKTGWGIPRKSWRNIVYKLIEHSDVGEQFEYLKELK